MKLRLAMVAFGAWVGLVACGPYANIPIASPVSASTVVTPDSKDPQPQPTSTVPRAFCAESNFVLCDDFEGATPGNPPNPNLWRVNVTNPNDLVEVTRGQAMNGNQALHIHVQANGAYQRAVMVPAAPVAVPGNILFGRAYVLLQRAMPTDAVTLFAAGGDLDTDNVWVRGGLTANAVELTYVGAGQTTTAPVSPPVGTWTCVEWQYDGTTSSVNVWLGGAELPALSVTPSMGWSAPTFSLLQLGWERGASTDGAWDVYFDSVAFSATARIRCAN